MSSLFTRARLLGLALAALVATFDQSTKWYVTRELGLNRIGDKLELLPFFDLTYTRNYGVSLGMLEATSMEMRWLLVLLTAGIALVVLVWLMREKRLGDILGLALILGGAIGNIYDRFTLGFVTDFADLHVHIAGDIFRPFLIFNVADAAITIGVVVILARALFVSEKDADSDAPSSALEN
ncbi:signal peptidase II [Erythrobacter sp.]|uniref:signal peptidase II n=1 Tax=Erythrobacter sp. TaxID=1042 RepID=UPI00261A8634|nr:signal peptidase II [Erythrobacter sp.]